MSKKEEKAENGDIKCQDIRLKFYKDRSGKALLRRQLRNYLIYS